MANNGFNIGVNNAAARYTQFPIGVRLPQYGFDRPTGAQFISAAKG